MDSGVHCEYLISGDIKKKELLKMIVICDNTEGLSLFICLSPSPLFHVL